MGSIVANVFAFIVKAACIAKFLVVVGDDVRFIDTVAVGDDVLLACLVGVGISYVFKS